MIELLTRENTEWLPSDWQGEYSIERANTWISMIEQDGGVVLIAEQRLSGKTVGILILSPSDGHKGMIVHLGYVISDVHAGHGFATELVKGFCDWSRDSHAVELIIAGVVHDHSASRRVLSKSGFVFSGNNDAVGSELSYEYRVFP